MLTVQVETLQCNNMLIHPILNLKVEKPNGTQRKGCLWALNPAKVGKMEEEVQKWKRKDPEAIRKSMSNPEEFDREMDELRRSDEEATRRRMLSMAGHGLYVPHPGYQYPPVCVGSPQHLHPGGSMSLPTTPHHYPPQQYRQPMTPGHRVAANHSSTFHFMTGRQRQPRQLFGCPNNSYHIGTPENSSTPNNRSMTSHTTSMTSHTTSMTSHTTSPHSSSGGSSMFGSLVDSIPTQNLNEIDLDSSLADLSMLQGSLWDGSGATLPPLDVGPVDPFDDSGGQTGNPLPDPGSSHMSEQVTSSDDPPLFTPGGRFHGNDVQFFNTKPVMLH
nr:forkhead box protein N1 [Ciona intestinalis]|eukprot:XP_018672849.2 forkhead box protein N1 [Ciona intestinalis]